MNLIENEWYDISFKVHTASPHPLNPFSLCYHRDVSSSLI